MKKIGLINCYFGNFPWYFSFFIKSCETNPTVDFIIFSDSKYDGYLPENVKIIHFTLTDFNLLASTKLGFEITVKKAYKLCDFKPSYGVLFSDFLVGYDFWGMCDIDIIFGRIREFMTDELLEEYDVINTRHDYLTGSFLLFKNNTEINSLFTKSKDYKKIFTSDKHYCFDECNFKHMQLELNMNIFDVPCEIESMEHIIRREYDLKNINVFFDFLVVDGLSGRLKWDNGLLSYGNKLEILLYHLIQFKSNAFLRKNDWNNIPNTFYIDKYTFRKKTKKTFQGLQEFYVSNKYIPYKSLLLNIGDYLISNFKRKELFFLTEGIYKNKLGDTYIYIDKNKTGKNIVSFKESSKTKRKSVSSKFRKDTFYIHNGFFTNYKFFMTEDGQTQKIQSMMFDGTITNYELLEK
ncbi:hypothetical protein FLA105534_04872 [Flavobacterium bizetiae]|uniref:Uncharacterized protein n=1 Tax=Flavobacterium bizetiae TaxID=2704140 RepID=A0A6J4GXR0_9FLAO|nr:DUF6625 family protein [Flavobacterium bizetiae]CAA9203692.1 hypothetical protein FLA105534_04872 [Flavobacterium bizetiae]CAD5344936.1 hypothetical protein FLA105535_04948 [Flavobacterium bizetiae]CAD5350910.1 hypothetical protein FLA105534_04911 [Flavobacterium bizetiae]